MPTVRVNGDYVFYLLNWSVVAGSPERPGGLIMRVPIRGGQPVRIADVKGGGRSRGLAVTPSAAVFIQVDGGDAGLGAIVSVPASGGDTTILAPTIGTAIALVADDTNVYFVDEEGTKSVPLAGGVVRTLTTQTPESITVAGGLVYLAEFYTPSGTSTLSSVPVAGGPVTLVVTDLDGGMFNRIACGRGMCWTSGTAFDARLGSRSL